MIIDVQETSIEKVRRGRENEDGVGEKRQPGAKNEDVEYKKYHKRYKLYFLNWLLAKKIEERYSTSP